MKGDRELAEVEETVRLHLAVGHQATYVSVSCMADGVSSWKFQRMQEAGQPRLLEPGLNVTGMTCDGWGYTAHFEVRAPQEREPGRNFPNCAEANKAEAVL